MAIMRLTLIPKKLMFARNAVAGVCITQWRLEPTPHLEGDDIVTTQPTMHRRGMPLALSVVTIAMLACVSREDARTDSAATADSAAAVTQTPAFDTTGATKDADTSTPAPTPRPTPRQPSQQPDTSKRSPITDQPVKSDPEPPATPPAVRPS